MPQDAFPALGPYPDTLQKPAVLVATAIALLNEARRLDYLLAVRFLGHGLDRFDDPGIRGDWTTVAYSCGLVSGESIDSCCHRLPACAAPDARPPWRSCL
jgi:hypothetical protein